MFKWTTKEIKELTDLEILRGILIERREQEQYININSPLYKKLTSLYNKIDKRIYHGGRDIKEI